MPDATTVQKISAILDQYVSSLPKISDAIASLSCEALKVDVSSIYSQIVDSRDGMSDKDQVLVADHIRTMLNGSKLPGLFVCEQVTSIPEVHGYLINVSRSIHSAMRVGMNSNAGYLATMMSPLGPALKRLGEISLGRIKLIADDSSISPNFTELCPKLGELVDYVKSFMKAYLQSDYVKSLNEIHDLSKIVMKILSWELAVALCFLNVNGFMTKKGKKKKVVMGKGTGVLALFIMEKCELETMAMEKWAEFFISILNPEDPSFELFLSKVKEVVDSEEVTRLPKIPKGTRDFATEQMLVREKTFKIIGDVFKRHGAMPLDTPVFELSKTLKAKYGEDAKLIYDLADQGGELCSLRYDLTVPFARYIALNGLTSFKRYQIGKVYRRDTPSKGRFREFYQCDFDIAGEYAKMAPDSEVVFVLTELLDELNIKDYEIKLNHRKLLDEMLDICGVPQEKFKTICSSIDKLDKQDFDQIRKEMVNEKGLSDEVADKIGDFVKKRGRPLELLPELKQSNSKFIENGDGPLKDLDILCRALEKAGCIDKIVLDLSLARGLDYYTGVIFEAVYKESTEVGSIAAGGRYDGLIGMLGAKEVPAVGLSLGIERVLTIMEQQNQVIGTKETEVLVSIYGDDVSLAFDVPMKCWKAKIKAELMVSKRLQKHFDRADELKVPWMIIVGENEVRRGVVQLKDMLNRTKQEFPMSDFVDELLNRLSTPK